MLPRLEDAYRSRFPDHSPEPTAKRAYAAGAADASRIIRNILDGKRPHGVSGTTWDACFRTVLDALCEGE